MKIKYFYPHWGSEHREFGKFCEEVSSVGCDGVKINLSTDPSEKKGSTWDFMMKESGGIFE